MPVMSRWTVRAGLLLLLAGVLWLGGEMPAQATPITANNAPTWETAPPGNLVSLNANLGADRAVIRVAPNGQLMTVFNRYNTAIGDKQPDPYYSLSNDDGQTWSPPAPIYQSGGTTSLYVTLTYDANNAAHAVWVENLALAYSKKSNWPGEPTYLSEPEDSPGALHPQLVSSGSNTLDAVWAEGSASTPRIYHKRSTNGGSSWTANTIPPSPYNASYPSLSIGPTGKLHMVWEDNLLDEFRVYYAEGTPAGSTVSWSNPILISGSLTKARRPQVLVNGNSVMVTFTRRNSDNQQWIYLTECTGQCLDANNWDNAGIISGQVVGVNTTDPTILISSMLQIGPCTFVYFHGTQPSAPPPLNENELIWGVNSCDGWGALRDEVTLASARSLYPVLAASEDRLHLVYETNSTGSRQIFHMRALPPADVNAPVFLPFVARSN